MFRRRQGLRDPQIMHPEREWVIALVMMVVIFSASASWSLVVYLQNREVGLEDVFVDQQQTIVYRENSVDNALELFKKREQELNELIGSMPIPEEEEVVATSTPVENFGATTTVEAASSTPREESMQ